MMESGKMVNETWTEKRLITLISAMQDKGEKVTQDLTSVTVETVKNADLAYYLAQHGVTFKCMWSHEESLGQKYSRCLCCGGTLDGYVNYLYCPHCGERMRG